MKRWLVCSTVFAVLTLSIGAQGGVTPDAAHKKMLEFNQMREALASTLDGRSTEITEDVFKQTCGKVGKAIQAWSLENGVELRQASDKNRNPANAAVGDDLRAIELFRADPKLDRYMQGKRLFVRIPVVQSCLHCHGDNKARPDFIRKRYPDDKAFDFKPGDVRGVYSISFR